MIAMSEYAQAITMVFVTFTIMTVIVCAIIHDATTVRRVRPPKSRFHWNDERAIAKLRHPSSRADVWECWDPRCDCHDVARLPYDWQRDPDLTSNTPT